MEDSLSETISVVFGTRPEAIKMAPIVRALKELNGHRNVSVCVTGQHREMLRQVLNLFDITPDYDLDVMVPNQTLAHITSAVMTSWDSYLDQVQPHVVLVHGDTTSAMAAGLASFYRRVPVAHVEAGLRTNDVQSPFPEELNRQIISKVASLHFAPTEWCRQNLLGELVSEESILVTGNTVIDALLMMARKLDNDVIFREGVIASLADEIEFDPVVEKFILVTAHRRENFGAGLDEICRAISDMSEKYPELHFVFPVHQNPKVSHPVRAALSHRSNIHLTGPLNYAQIVYLMKNMFLSLTDSGGIQEEAPTLGKPVLVMREKTERPEGIEAGTVLLVGSRSTAIVSGVTQLLEDTKLYNAMARIQNPYGDGHATERILRGLDDFLLKKSTS